MKSRGFTLIELMVVISIIAILTAIGLVSYSAVAKQGRDSKRQSDLRSIQSALEQYRADQSSYPASLPAAGNPLKSPDGTKTYLNQLPQEPLGSPQYGYNLVSTSYCVYARLENSNPGLGNCPFSSSYNFTVTPP